MSTTFAPTRNAADQDRLDPIDPDPVHLAPVTHELDLRAMGTDVHLIVTGTSVDQLSLLLDRAVDRIEVLEQRWSRFRPDSEVSRLNAAAGAAVTVSDDTVLLVRTAIAAHRESGGSFDPLVLGAMIAAGYDRTFDDLRDEAPAGRPGSSAPVATQIGLSLIGPEDIEIDGHAVRLPAGTGFDPGGIGKGLAADLVTFDLMQAGAAGACVNLGGDVRVRGIGPDGGPWTVAVEHPDCDAPVVLVGLHDGAVATSTTLKRRWTVGGVVRHHLIDPATGAPSETDLVLATAVAAEGWQAEILAKSVLLRGAQHPFDVIDGGGAEALAVTARGDVLRSDGFAAFTGDTPIPTRIPDPIPAPRKVAP